MHQICVWGISPCTLSVRRRGAERDAGTPPIASRATPAGYLVRRFGPRDRSCHRIGCDGGEGSGVGPLLPTVRTKRNVSILFPIDRDRGIRVADCPTNRRALKTPASGGGHSRPGACNTAGTALRAAGGCLRCRLPGRSNRPGPEEGSRVQPSAPLQSRRGSVRPGAGTAGGDAPLPPSQGIGPAARGPIGVSNSFNEHGISPWLFLDLP